MTRSIACATGAVLAVTAGLVASTATPAATTEIASSAAEIRPILIGAEVPDVIVRTVEGEPESLREAIGGKPTVLVVYRGGWCPICSSQLSDLAGVEKPLSDMGVQLVAISADDPERLRASKGKHEIGYTLLSDFELNAATAMGLAFRVSDEYVDKLASYGLDTEGNTVSTAQVLPVPGVFVVDTEGVITFSYVNPNYQVRCDRDVLLAAARVVAKAS